MQKFTYTESSLSWADEDAAEKVNYCSEYGEHTIASFSVSANIDALRKACSLLHSDPDFHSIRIKVDADYGDSDCEVYHDEIIATADGDFGLALQLFVRFEDGHRAFIELDSSMTNTLL